MQIVYDHNCLRVIDGAVSPDVCREIVEGFERDSARHRRRTSDWVNLEEMTLIDHVNPIRRLRSEETWKPITDQLVGLFNPLADEYARTWAQHEGVVFLPKEYAMEGMKVKCYRPNGVDQFKMHVDVSDKASAGRFLSFLLYLNDSDGGTEFPLLNKTIAAQEGRLIMFPPLWTYPHAGQQPQDGRTKYILSTYLHYL